MESWRGRLRQRPGGRTVVAVAGVVVAAAGAVIGLRGLLRVGLPLQVANVTAVTPMDLTAGAANNSPRVLADPKDSRFVVLANRVDAPDFSCALQVSGDGGLTWLSVRPVRVLPAGADKCYAPEVAFDRTGTLFFLFVGLHGNGNEPMGVFLSASTDLGHSFTSPVSVLGPLNFGVRMAIDPSLGARGRLHLVWLHATSAPSLGGFGPAPNPIMSAYSDDGGRTLSRVVQVSDPGRAQVVAPALALGPGHAVYVGYYDLGRDLVDYQGLGGATWDQAWSVVMTASSDGGRHFGPSVVVDRAVIPPGRVMLIFTMPPVALAVDKGKVCVAWTDGRHGDNDVLLRCSPDRGKGWGAKPLRLNDDTVGNGRDQYLPQLSVSPQGRIDAIFYDRRGDPYNILNDVTYTYSTDGGQHFSANVKLNQRQFDSRIGQQYAIPSAQGLVEFGSRLGLLSLRSGPVAVWTDTSNSTGFTTSQDLMAAQVALPGGGFRPDSSVPVGIVLLAGGLSVFALATRRRRPARDSETAPRVPIAPIGATEQPVETPIGLFGGDG